MSADGERLSHYYIQHRFLRLDAQPGRGGQERRGEGKPNVPSWDLCAL